MAEQVTVRDLTWALMRALENDARNRDTCVTCCRCPHGAEQHGGPSPTFGHWCRGTKPDGAPCDCPWDGHFHPRATEAPRG